LIDIHIKNLHNFHIANPSGMDQSLFTPPKVQIQIKKKDNLITLHVLIPFYHSIKLEVEIKI